VTPLKATDRFTSLMIIGMTKIMCNNGCIIISCGHCIYVYPRGCNGVRSHYHMTFMQKRAVYVCTMLIHGYMVYM
jgi:hypothetical protein